MRPVVLTSLALAALLAAPAFVPAGATPPTPVAYALYPAPVVLGDGAGEPSIGVNWNTGAVLAQVGTRTVRATFDQAVPAAVSWASVTPPLSRANIDPILFTDATQGRTWAGGLDGQCSILEFTDDDGGSWTPVANACASPAYDHQTIGSGPWRPASIEPTTNAALWPHAVYYCAHEVEILCAVSFDGGLTYSPGVPISPGLNCAGLHGSVHVGPNGVAWLPVRSCGANSGVVTSTTNGRLWITHPLPGGRPDNGFDPDVATTPSGWAYVGYADDAGHPTVVLTKNNAQSWHGGPWDVGAAAGIQTASFIEMVAGDDARATIVYLGTTTAGDAYKEGFPGVWHVYASTTLDAGATWTTVQLTQDPVQRGWICAAGLSCPDTGTRGRNLLDFFDAQVAADGRVLVAFADGCVNACAGPAGTASQSTSDLLTIARQTCGPSLFAAQGNLEGAFPCSIALPTPPSVPLSGTLYARSAYPVGNLGANPGVNAGGQPDLDARTLSRDAPTSATPSVQSTFPVVGATVTGTALAAQWAIPAPDGGWRLDGATVTVRLFVGGEGVLSQRLNVSLYDAGIGLAASSPSPQSLANKTVQLPSVAAAPTEVVVTFTGVSGTLARGFAVAVESTIIGDAQLYYDSVDFPTRVEIS